MPRQLLAIGLFFLSSGICYAWHSGELLIWMDANRARGLQTLEHQYETKLGIHVRIESPPDIVNSFTIAASGQGGPDIVFWAHDKVAQWAEGGLISALEIRDEVRARYFPLAWQGLAYQGQTWGYPIAFEALGLICNTNLLKGPPPSDFSEIEEMNRSAPHGRYTTFLCSFRDPYYAWAFLAGAGGYIFKSTPDGFDVRDIGVDQPGAIRALTRIVELINGGVVPRRVDYGDIQTRMATGQLKMMVGGPWTWADLDANQIPFEIAPLPGIDGAPAKSFVGVSAAYLNRSSPNHDLAMDFLENCVLTPDGLRAMNSVGPIGVPANKAFYTELAQKDPRIAATKANADAGELIPNVPAMGRFWTAFGAALDIALNGQATPEQALRQAAKDMRRGF
jgi:maltose/maltodextrin transport system substrate-binding protein